jgi:hypothetical protein
MRTVTYTCKKTDNTVVTTTDFDVANKEKAGGADVSISLVEETRSPEYLEKCRIHREKFWKHFHTAERS